MKPTNADYPTLDLTFIRQQLAHSSIGHTLDYHTSVPSTMPIAAELAQDPATPSGMIVVAEEQTSGRGRRGRSWHAPYASALACSISSSRPIAISPRPRSPCWRAMPSCPPWPPSSPHCRTNYAKMAE